ncbi:MAG: hypothetical protein JW797_09170 [Bradymonadales bacterium]|nr:hypothetical protein [Bradymonadales bacterium]
MAESTWDWHKLQKQKVDNLRDIAKDIPGVAGVTAMKKEELIEVVADHFGVQRPRRVITGIRKEEIKREIRDLKKERDKALEAHDSVELKRIRRSIHKKKRTLRQAASVR